ncbi:MAG TPA: FtsX-like permease family protein [Phycisphaerae bacterium]|nr:FtsX-like permease family protein [Phycisphaerae bacterium]
MTLSHLVWRNLWRNKVRALLTIASVAVSLFLFTLLHAVVTSMKAVAASSANQLRLVVRQKTTMTKLLPLGHGPKIAALPGVQAVCAMRWFGGRVENSPEQFPSVAVERETMPKVYSDFELRDEEIKAWDTDRTAAIVGAGLAKRLDWSPGQRVTLRGGIPPYPTLEFHIVAVTAAQAYPNLFVLRLDYLLDALKAIGTMQSEYYDAANFFWVKVAPGAMDSVRNEIDATFANSLNATRTELEESFVASFTKMFGDLPELVNSVGVVVLATILLVVANTVTISMRERESELAVLKAIGYPPRRIFATVLGESALLGFIGGAIGCVPALASMGSAGEGLSMPYFPVIYVTPATVLLGVAVGALIGLVGGVAPAWKVARLPVSVTLRDES